MDVKSYFSETLPGFTEQPHFEEEFKTVMGHLQVRYPVDVDRHEVDNFSGGGVLLARDRHFERLPVDG